MTYTMKVVIFDPSNPTKERTLEARCEFAYDADDYGNGHWLALFFDNGCDYCEDLRYFKEIAISNKIGILTWWATSRWNGKGKAWSIKSLEIAKAD